MKRSELIEIAKTVAAEEGKKLVAATDDKELFTEMFVSALAEIPVLAARTTVEIISRSGLIQFDPEETD